MQVEWRRTPFDAPPTDDPGEPELIEQLRSEIAAGGPITFARFMERALYEPGLGYYAISADRPTRAGDFLTAPELHPIFGRTIARHLEQMWVAMGRPEPYTVREYGAGSGAIGRAIGEWLERSQSPLAGRLRYEPIEIGPRMTGPAPTGAMVGCVIANEFVDALPVHRVEMQVGRPRELLVGWSDGQFVEVAGELSNDGLAAWFAETGATLAEGQRAEANLRMLDWIASVADNLERGVVLVLDYGGSTEELRSPQRSRGTVRAFRGQHVSSDVLAAVGHQDLTAHVDFDALERAARAAGLDVLARTSQAQFLLAAGLEQEYAAARAEADADWDSATALRGAVRRLLDPRALGGYTALTLGKGMSS